MYISNDIFNTIFSRIKFCLSQICPQNSKTTMISYLGQYGVICSIFVLHNRLLQTQSECIKEEAKPHYGISLHLECLCHTQFTYGDLSSKVTYDISMFTSHEEIIVDAHVGFYCIERRTDHVWWPEEMGFALFYTHRIHCVFKLNQCIFHSPSGHPRFLACVCKIDLHFPNITEKAFLTWNFQIHPQDSPYWEKFLPNVFF